MSWAKRPGAALHGFTALHDEHREAANTLRMQIREIGGEPEHSAGPWGVCGWTSSMRRPAPWARAARRRSGSEAGRGTGCDRLRGGLAE